MSDKKAPIDKVYKYIGLLSRAQHLAYEYYAEVRRKLKNVAENEFRFEFDADELARNMFEVCLRFDDLEEIQEEIREFKRQLETGEGGK